VPIAVAALTLTAGLVAPAASAADFWLHGRYTAATVKRSCDAHGGQFYIRGGLRYHWPPPCRTLQGFLGAAASAPPQARPQ
jgi:hypothetical protein